MCILSNSIYLWLRNQAARMAKSSSYVGVSATVALSLQTDRLTPSLWELMGRLSGLIFFTWTKKKKVPITILKLLSFLRDILGYGLFHIGSIPNSIPAGRESLDESSNERCFPHLELPVLTTNTGAYQLVTTTALASGTFLRATCSDTISDAAWGNSLFRLTHSRLTLR